MSYHPKVYRKPKGAGLVIQSGGTFDAESGSTSNLAGTTKIGGVTLTASAAELNKLTGVAADVTFSPAAGAANICEVTIAVKDAAGATIAGVFSLDVYLSDAATGAGLTAVTASGTVTAKAASGAVIGTHTAKKALRVQTLATGVFILEITDTAKTGFYVVATVPGTGRTAVSAQLVTGNYG